MGNPRSANRRRNPRPRGLTAAKLNPLGEAPKPISTTFETQPTTWSGIWGQRHSLPAPCFRSTGASSARPSASTETEARGAPAFCSPPLFLVSCGRQTAMHRPPERTFSAKKSPCTTGPQRRSRRCTGQPRPRCVSACDVDAELRENGAVERPLVLRRSILKTRQYQCLRNGGGSGIRTHEALAAPTRSPGVRLRPLGHPSSPAAPARTI